jgi:hypothetical protein
MASLATVEELETYLGRALTDQAQAQALLDMASSSVRTYCGWELSKTTATMYQEGAGTSLMTLPTLCLTDVIELRADGVFQDPAKYPIKWSRKGQIWGYWMCTVQYEFDVEHGYDPIPDVLKLVTMDLTSKSLSNPEGLTSATTGQVSRTWGGTSASSTTGTPFSPLHAGLLDRYSL